MSAVKKETYLGLYLSGLKKDNSRLIVLEHFEAHNKVAISQISSEFKKTGLDALPDELLLEEIQRYENPVSLCVNFPTTAPPCVGCELNCPGVKNCSVGEVKTLVREFDKKTNLTPKSKKHTPFPVPYVERAIDFYTAYLLEEEFPFEPAYSANRASLLRRGKFLKKRLNHINFVECSVKASLWRLGLQYDMRKSVMRNFFKDLKSQEYQKRFLDRLEQDFFLYEEDKKTFLSDINSFRALICALSGYHFDQEETDTIPAYFLTEGLDFSLPL